MGSGGWSSLGCAALILGCTSAQPATAAASGKPSSIGRSPGSEAPRIASTVPPGSKWAAAPVAKPPAPSRPDGSCLSDSGCPHSAAVLPACAAGLEAPDLGLVADELGGYLGKPVMISGRLLAHNDTASELVQCHGCCAPRRTPLRFVPRHGRAPALRLLEPGSPEAFVCQADASQLCCNFDLVLGNEGAEARAVVFGKLIQQPGEPRLFALEAPALCSL